jgi:hypothetical protein
MRHNKPPGPNGFSTEFYWKFWDVIKMDHLHLFSSLNVGQLDLFHLNFCEMILLPKVNEAKRIQQYMHICLLNISLK